MRRLVRKLIPVNLRWRLYFWGLANPAIAPLYIRARRVLRASRITRGTILVIDGFPRSANSYARVAFEAANPHLARGVSSHLHSTWAIRRAVRRGLPVMLLVRNPLDATASLVQLAPGLRIETALRLYVNFYRQLLPICKHVELVRFSDATVDFPSVVVRCNERFGTRFNPARPAAVSEEEIFTRIDQRVSDPSQLHRFESVVSRPSRRRMDAETVFESASQRARDLLVAAERCYSEVLRSAE